MRDLHLHLSGATSPRVLWEIIRDSGYKTGIKNYFAFEEFTSLTNKGSLDNYLDILHWVDRAQSSPSAIKTCVYDAFVSSYLSGCTELQLRFNPVKRSQEGAIDLDSLIVAARAGMELAKDRFGIEGGLILCLGRDVSAEANAAVARKAFQYHRKGVVGIDIAGPYHIPPAGSTKEISAGHIERMHKLHEFDRIYQEANNLGMITTVHCGEEPHRGVAEEIAYVLEVLRPRRIGHGIQIWQHPDLMEFAESLNVHFEVCISSNLSTGVVKSKEEMGQILGAFLEHGLEYSINTDATYLLRTDIKRENALHEEILGLRVAPN